MNSQSGPTSLFLTYFSSMNFGHISDNFELHISLKHCFRNMQVLHSNFVDCESFLESNSSNILALCNTILGDSIDSGNFSARGYLSLIWNYSSSHVHSLAVYVKEGPPFAPDLSLENSADSYLCFWLALLHSVPYFFPFIDHLLYLYAKFFILFHLT